MMRLVRLMILLIIANCLLCGAATSSDWTKTHGSAGDDGTYFNASVLGRADLFVAGSKYIGFLGTTHDLVFYSYNQGTTVETLYSVDFDINPFSPNFGNAMVEVHDVFYRALANGFVAGFYAEGAMLESLGNMRAWLANSTDGGYTWDEVGTSPAVPRGLLSFTLHGIAFNGTEGYAVGNMKRIYRSANGGAACSYIPAYFWAWASSSP